MKTLEKIIFPLIESHFPAFYKEQGPVFLLFVEEYFKWLEDNTDLYSNYSEADLPAGNVNYHVRRLLDYKDIDRTVDLFLSELKEKYIKNVNPLTSISKRRLIKAAQDLFNSKGSERSLELFFKLVFGTDIEIYVPANDILKPSDGKWVLPTYLEVTRTDRTVSYVGREIIGLSSSAKAFVEYIITRNISGNIIDIVYLSSVEGNFQAGEKIVESNNQIVANAPTVLGSLNSVTITTPGESFSLGEIVNIQSARGVEGQAVVTAVESATGVLRFTLVDGGFGYSLTANAIISETTLGITNVVNANNDINTFYDYEIVSQNLYSFSLTNVTGNLNDGVEYINGDTSATPKSISTIVTQSPNSNTANIVLNQISANIFSNSILIEKNSAYIVTDDSVVFTIGTAVTQEDAGSNTNAGAISNTANVTVLTVNTSTISSNGIHVGTFLRQATTNATGYVYISPRESNFAFTNVSSIAVSNVSVNAFSNTDTITVYPSATNATSLGTFDPTNAKEGYAYLLNETNITSNTRWSSQNTVFSTLSPTVNTTILIASDLGGIVSSCTDVTATGNTVDSNTSAIGLFNVSNIFYYAPGALIYGVTSNTYANVTAKYLGSLGDFEITSLDLVENVYLNTDYLNDVNSNNTAFLSVGLIDSNYYFDKIATSNVNTILQSALTFASVNVGTITSISTTNPGETYSNDPFVIVLERASLGHGARDLYIEVSGITGGGFVNGEFITQSTNVTSFSIASNNYSGNTTTYYEVGEFVYASNGTANTANGIVQASGINPSTNSIATTILFSDGTWANGDTITGLTSNLVSTIIDVSSSNSTSIATGKIVFNNANSVLTVKKYNMFIPFIDGETVTGVASGTTAKIEKIHLNLDFKALGENAIITANAISSNGGITTVQVTDSGIGYVNNEQVTIRSSTNTTNIAIGRSQVARQGTGAGYFATTDSFLNANKYIIDGEYYQNYSYEIQTSISFDVYYDMLRKVMHIAGKKVFGKVNTLSQANINIVASSNVVIS